MKTQRLTKKQKIIRILLPSAIVIFVTGYLMYPAIPRNVADKAKFAYCRRCDKETRHIPGEDLKPCLYCGRETIGLEDSIKKVGKPKNPYFPMFIACWTEAIITMAFLYYLTKPTPSAEEEKENFLSMRCPHCRRKLRYRESQQGHLGQCPRCKRALKFAEQSAQEIA